MTVVKQLVYDDVTICATIHSPTSYCFSLFDKLMMLVRGQVVYFGKGGSARGGGVCRLPWHAGSCKNATKETSAEPKLIICSATVHAIL